MNRRFNERNIFEAVGELFDRVRKLEFRLTAAVGNARILAGALYNDANIISGTGFTAEWADEDGSTPGANIYTIRFDSPFSEPGPVVSLTANNNNPETTEGAYGVSLKTRDPNFIVVETQRFDGTAADGGGFDFLCAEPS